MYKLKRTSGDYYAFVSLTYRICDRYHVRVLQDEEVDKSVSAGGIGPGSTLSAQPILELHMPSSGGA